MEPTSLTLVAHRGYQYLYPENTLLAIDAAYEAGIKHIEFDIQLSSDHQAVVYHDATLDRVSGISGAVHTYTLNQLRQITACEPSRFGERYSEQTITALKNVANWAKKRPDVTLYVEIKPEVLEHTELETTVKAVIDALSGMLNQYIIMSFSQPIVSKLDQIAGEYDLKTGLVVKNWEDYQTGNIEQFIAQTSSLAVVFCNHLIIPDTFDSKAQTLPWVLYETQDLETIQRFAQMGCTHFESFLAPELAEQLNTAF